MKADSAQGQAEVGTDDKPRKPQLKPEPYTPSFESPMAPPFSPYTLACGPKEESKSAKTVPYACQTQVTQVQTYPPLG